MGSRMELTASDGYILSADRADPPGEARGGIVIVRKVYGVNDHVRGGCDGYAADGYAVWRRRSLTASSGAWSSAMRATI